MSDFATIEWGLSGNILFQVLDRVGPRALARCSCVAKSWREIVASDCKLKRKVGLERAWVHDPIDPIVYKEHGVVHTFCYAKQGNLLALGGPYRFKVLDFTTKNIVFDCDETGSVQSLAFVDGSLLSGGCDGDLCGWDTSSWGKLFQISIFNCYIFTIANLGGGVAVGGFDGDLQVWKKGEWVLDRKLVGHTDNVYILVVEGKLLFSGSLDETIRIWDLTNDACLRIICGQKEGVSSMAVSGGEIFCGANDGIIRAWELQSGDFLRDFRGHRNSVTSIIAQGDRILSGSHDGNVKVWNAKGTPTCVRSFECYYGEKDEHMYIVDVFWATEETLYVVNGDGEIWEWNF